MKKRAFLIPLSCLLFISFFLNSCIKDTVSNTYTYTLYRPVFKTTAAVRADIKSSSPVAVSEPGKLLLQGHFIFMNEVNKGVHIIDNTDPAQPRNIAFIAIPGNVDIAVKGTTLYADLYTDLVAIDIADPLHATVLHILENVFPERYYNSYIGADSALVITDWIVKDTTVTDKYVLSHLKEIEVDSRTIMYSDNSGGFALYSSATPAAAVSPIGIGGSMARFTIVGDRLYTVGTDALRTINIARAGDPSFSGSTNIGFGIETIYPFKNQLFIGSTAGMFVYALTDPDHPVQVSRFSHVQSCDPVIADGENAYVTLRSGTVCNGFTNQLEVLNIASLAQPFLIKVYPMTHPSGLSKDGNLLFICDGTDGLKLFDATKPDDVKLLQTVPGLEPYDVIARGGLAIVVAKEGLYQFDYSDATHIRQLSKLTLN